MHKINVISVVSIKCKLAHIPLDDLHSLNHIVGCICFTNTVTMLSRYLSTQHHIEVIYRKFVLKMLGA